MREFFISLDTKDGMMTLDTYEDAVIKIVRDMNTSREEGRVQVWIISIRQNILGGQKELIENIIRLLDTTSINDLDIHIISDDDYLVVGKDTRHFARSIIEEYKSNDHVDVIVDVKIDAKIITSDDRVEVLKLLKETGQKYLHIWLNVTGESIADFPAVITRLDMYKLLDITSITFDVDIYGSLTKETREQLKSLPIYIMNYLMDKYIEEMEVWQKRNPVCYNYDGEVIWKCPLYRECVLVSRKRSKARMAGLLIAIVRDLPKHLEDIMKADSNIITYEECCKMGD